VFRTTFAAGVTYVIAGIGFLFWGLLGHDTSFLLVTVLPALLCVTQAYFQRRALWVIIFGLYLLGTVLYSGLILIDVLSLVTGGGPRVLLDVDDSAVFLIFLLFLAGTTWALFRVRAASPQTQPASNNRWRGP